MQLFELGLLLAWLLAFPVNGQRLRAPTFTVN
jgi:hypothetical protein